MNFAAPLPLSRIGFQTSQNSGVGAACVCAWGPYAPHEIGPSVRYVPSCYPVPLWDMWGFSAPRAGGVIVEGPLN